MPRNIQVATIARSFDARCQSGIYLLLKALPPVCMKYTAQGESGVSNIAQAKPSAILSRDSHQELYILYKQSSCALNVLLYFTLTKVSAKYSSLVILTHLLNK